MQDLIVRVSHAISDHDGDGFTLQGVALNVEGGKLAAWATDRHRMAIAEVNGQPRTAKLLTLIQTRASALISAMEWEGDATIGTDDRFTVLAIGDRTVYSRNSEGRFPDLRKMVPAKEAVAIVGADAFSGAIRRAGITRGDLLRFDVDRASITITATSSRGETSEKVACDYSGPAFSVGYEASYIADAIGAMRSDQVMLEFAKTDDAAPLLLRAEPPDETCDHIEIVMPRSM